MSNRLHQSLAEAIAEAPVEPAGSYYEISPVGSAETMQRQVRKVIAQAEGLCVGIYSSLETLNAYGLGSAIEMDAVPIHVGSTEGLGYFRFKLSHRATRGP
jgi:hypothetical protein